MTRITTFQAAGILVAALMCFPAVCYAYNKTITRTSTTTGAITNGPTTKTASNMTTTGHKQTTASNMTTTGHKQTTASNMTTTGPTTITASNMTTTGHKQTTESNMKTTGPTTTDASNMKTTEAPTTPEPKTTAASNMTTESGTTSTTQSVTPGGTTSAPKARWEVRDKDGKLCMIMDFDGTITDVINGVTEKIPSHASTSASDCSSSSYSAFVLDFNTIFTEWRIVLNFTTRGGSFMLHTLSASRSTLRTPLSSSVTEDFFNVPLGDYYTCSHFNYSLGYLQLNLTNPSLQPFVQRTEGGDNLGQAYVCRPAQESDSNTLKLDRKTKIGLGVGIPIALIVIVCCGCCCCCCGSCGNYKMNYSKSCRYSSF
ncbi:mucin-5AC-like [Strongylocentrotus purpuratus]|uniref:Uncharacterized protein n=1 Tax=Strongylocentrotus purpuratus TaxID=7668 RepID=A0A7M7SXG1_STRPU|nr:mucin-5AC-like [Strongylocentrotus purpuratus]|eukprot:XP_011667869.1 PREDICTED: mucin-5AC isoform X1 [Strongylocentrotus purpuratus]